MEPTMDNIKSNEDLQLVVIILLLFVPGIIVYYQEISFSGLTHEHLIEKTDLLQRNVKTLSQLNTLYHWFLIGVPRNYNIKITYKLYIRTIINYI